MKRLQTFEDLGLKVTIGPGRQLASRKGGLDAVILLTARVIGTDGFVRDEVHVVEFGLVKITSRSVRATWQEGQLVRPELPNLIDRDSSNRGSPARTVTIPRVFTGPAARRSMADIRRRMSLLLAPQHGFLFGLTEARDFCANLHAYIVVNDVMSS